MSDLDYAKQILKKVSFDPQLFKRELEKALRRLKGDDQTQLCLWASMYVQRECSWRLAAA